MVFRSFCFVILLVLLAATTLAETITVDVTITLIDTKRSSITVSYDGKSRQLELAKNLQVEFDGKKSEIRSLKAGDSALVEYDKERQVVTRIIVRTELMQPAAMIAEGWDEIDQRLIFLMVRLANLEASLEAIEQVVDSKNRQVNSKSSAAKRADRANEDMDRMGGGPVKWSQFYGMTAEKFFYHPTDRNSTYHTVTILNQQGSQADNKVGGGVPSSQGLPVHQRPPQFDYIYRANEKARTRADAEAAELKGKLDQLVARRQRLEAEQAGLWVEIAFRAIAHYDLDKKPMYRFEPLMLASDTTSRQRTEVARASAVFMAIALSIIAEAEKDQSGTFIRIKPTISKARQSLSDALLKLAVDVTEKQSTVGRMYALAKKLDDIAANLTDSYLVAIEGDSAKDQQRKDTFRGQLQQSLLAYAQIILAMDEMSSQMKYEYGYQPDIEKPIKLTSVMSVSPVIPNYEPMRTDRPSDGNPLFSTSDSKRSSSYDPTPDFDASDRDVLFPLATENLNNVWTSNKIGEGIDNWRLNRGVLKLVSKGADIRTRDVYQDFDLHLEFRLPPANNSGVFLRGRYEIQLLDTQARSPNGKEFPLNMQCGSIWKVYAPSQLVYNGENQWNTIDARLIGNIVTVKMNGVTIIEGKELTRPTDEAMNVNESGPGPIILQAFGNSIGQEFRNIRIKVISR
jgi:hypothetical protein